ncbi:uncharacterized protein LOC105176135 [Sesamum indicum]|uniref:Uncharacterized protein LOC105176135 n=1 Tax=Sesamum indicum TaxID=4182 RepID=A0A6I9UR22_SESIN|nr:uncharacterized protein LOC105176135 [Sesamum indicum]XP_011097149.1 uncharacterized protein LOC105176135 [Sesamum indicum]
MGDHFVLLVDKLLTESTPEAAIQSKNGFSFDRLDLNLGSSPGKLAECRICHDEDEDSNMEIPCSCRGSLKYAHHKCVQRWCNEKGDTICEICHQQFKPGYTAPPPLFHYGGVPMNFRGDWTISRSDMHDSELAEMVSRDENFLDPYFDEYPIPTSRSLICCRVVAVILIVLLALRHTLPFIIYGAGEYSISLFTLLMLRMVGILLPIYIMVKALTAIQRRRNHQESPIFPLPSSEKENELAQHQQHSHLIHVP